jgi:hypothetical protein
MIAMKPVVFLRIAAMLTLIHALMHTIGGVFGKVSAGPATVAVQAMKSNVFPVMGAMRSFWDFHQGLGLGVSIFLSAEAVVFWQLASLAKKDARRLRPIVATFLVGYALLALNSYTYFFIGPVIAEVMIAVCLALAILTAKSDVRAWFER